MITLYENLQLLGSFRKTWENSCFSACRKDQKNYFYGVCKRSNSEVSSQSRFFRGKNVVRVHEITNEAVYSLPNGSFQIYNIFI